MTEHEKAHEEIRVLTETKDMVLNKLAKEVKKNAELRQNLRSQGESIRKLRKENAELKAQYDKLYKDSRERMKACQFYRNQFLLWQGKYIDLQKKYSIRWKLSGLKDSLFGNKEKGARTDENAENTEKPEKENP